MDMRGFYSNWRDFFKQLNSYAPFDPRREAPELCMIFVPLKTERARRAGVRCTRSPSRDIRCADRRGRWQGAPASRLMITTALATTCLGRAMQSLPLQYQQYPD